LSDRRETTETLGKGLNDLLDSIGLNPMTDTVMGEDPVHNMYEIFSPKMTKKHGK